MKTHKILALFLCCLPFCQISQAQTQTSVEDVRVARLAGLAKVLNDRSTRADLGSDEQRERAVEKFKRNIYTEPNAEGVTSN